ncbi:MAG: hypothetical protein HYV93_19110 [Candidatus Rokubacteria bacterium]|nr:hypothetical protein [Candidatus Rokubacteria bacterium]
MQNTLRKNGRRFESEPSHAIVPILTSTEASRDVMLVRVVDDDVDQRDPALGGARAMA